MSTLLGPVIKAIEQGVVRFVGLSNCTVAQIQETQQLLPAGKLLNCGLKTSRSIRMLIL